MLNRVIGLLLSSAGFVFLMMAVSTANKTAFQLSSAFSIPSILVGLYLLVG